MSAMFGNMWTTVIGIALGMVTYISQSGPVMPTTKADWMHLLVGALLAGLGITAKDAVTGSKPGG